MIKSEIVVPAFGHILGELISDVSAQTEQVAINHACQTLWLAADAMNKLTCCFKEGGEFVSVALSNERNKIASFIEEKTGVDPILNKDFATW